MTAKMKIMVSIFALGLSTTFGLVLMSSPQTAVAATSCEGLAKLALPNTTITTAQSVAAGAFAPAAAAGGRGGRGGGNAFANLPAFCRVAATLKPSTDSDIKIEVWLPASGWNGKFQAFGNGGWSGSITPDTLAGGLRGGYAVSMTDTGHEGGSASFAMGHPEKLIDYGYRAVHEMTVKAKAIVTAFYGNGPKYSYWNGCSAGGKQGLKEAQKYPEDYDGIIAGSPGANWTGRAIQAVWIGQAAHKEPGSAIPNTKYAMIHDAVLAACDANDGVKDRVIENPRACKFEPKTLECKGGDAADCLTAPQVELARQIYAPVVNTRTKKEVNPGMEPGSEMGWATMAGANPFSIGLDLFRYVVFQDANWDYKTFNFDSDLDKTEKADNGTMNALDPNLKAFFARGGKILQYHGWTDPQIAPATSVVYYQSVLDAMGGAAKVRDNYRLFMVPGMNHCQGGDGPDTFDKLATLEQWVEKGLAPDQIVASHVASGRTRPLCPYPQVASYKGTGSTNEAANFVCK